MKPRGGDGPMYLRPLGFALLAAGSSTVPPAAARGIDSRDVPVPVEHAICSPSALRASDARIAHRYFVLRTTLDANAAGALRDDRRWFAKARDRAVERLRGADLIDALADGYAARAAFDAIGVAAPGRRGMMEADAHAQRRRHEISSPEAFDPEAGA